MSAGANPKQHCVIIETADAKLWFIGANDYEEGVDIIKKLVEEEDAWLVSLGGGWGYDGLAKLAEIVGDKVPVGVTYFPAYEGPERIKAKLKKAVVFHCKGCDPERQRAIIDTPKVKIWLAGVEDFKQGVVVARKLVKEQGVEVIELCGAWGYAGGATVQEAVGSNARVGIILHQYNDALVLAKLLEHEKEHHSGVVPRPNF